MNFQIIEGKMPHATKTCLYGAEGIGKSSMCASLKDVLFIDTEKGTMFLNTRRMTPKNWIETYQMIEYAIKNNLCLTLVIDSIDWLEHMCAEYICTQHQKKSIEEFGYGKGYTYLKEEMQKLLNLLNKAVEQGINVILIGHYQIKKMEQPEDMSSYDRYELKLSKQVAPLIKEWCDNLLFVNYKSDTVTTENGKVKQIGNKRMLYAERTATFDAKNRCGLPAESKMDYDILQRICDTAQPAPPTNEALRKLASMVEEDGDADVEFIEESYPDLHSQLVEQLLNKLNEAKISRETFEPYVWQNWQDLNGKHIEEFNDEMLTNTLNSFETVKKILKEAI